MSAQAIPAIALFNVIDYGATGQPAGSAQAAIQRAIDTCAAAGGGVVYFPPGAYTTGTLHLRSHVRILVEAGATLYSSKDRASFDKPALFFADGVENITLEGRGTIDGLAEYQWRDTEYLDWNIYSNQVLAKKAGVPMNRSFPTDNSVGHLVLFLHCRDVRIETLNFLHSPS